MRCEGFGIQQGCFWAISEGGVEIELHTKSSEGVTSSRSVLLTLKL